MLALTLLSIAVLPPATGTRPAVVPSQDPPIRITLNSSEYSPGDRVTVRVQTRDDGYLIVFRVDGGGHVRVLFPLDPQQDAFVRGGRRYELRGRADRQTFFADDVAGTGLIYAAVSTEPMVLRDYVVGDHWDYQALRLNDPGDAENELSQIVTRMTSRASFDYDVLGYRVRDIVYANAYGGAYYPLADPVVLYPGAWYDPYRDCLGCHGSGLHISIGIGSGWYGWNRWGWGSYYDPWGWGYPYNYGYGYGRPWGYPDIWYPGQTWPYTVWAIPRPRVPATPYALRPRPRSAPVPVGALAGGLTGTFTPRGSVGTVPRPEPVVGRSRPRSPELRREPPAVTGSARPNSPPAVVQGQASTAPAPRPSTNSGNRSRPRGGGEVEVQQANPPVMIDRRPEPIRSTDPAPVRVRREPADVPVYREPLPSRINTGERARPEPRRGEWPTARPSVAPQPRVEQPRVYREPTRPAEPRPVMPSPPPRVERPSPPPTQSAPPANSGSSQSGRSRSRGGR